MAMANVLELDRDLFVCLDVEPWVRSAVDYWVGSGCACTFVDYTTTSLADFPRKAILLVDFDGKFLVNRSMSIKGRRERTLHYTFICASTESCDVRDTWIAREVFVLCSIWCVLCCSNVLCSSLHNGTPQLAI